MASERVGAQTQCSNTVGVRSTNKSLSIDSQTQLESWTRGGKSPVGEIKTKSECVSRVAQDTRNPVWRKEEDLLRLNTTKWPIANSTVRESWKEPREGSEIEPETLCLQADRAR